MSSVAAARLARATSRAGGSSRPLHRDLRRLPAALPILASFVLSFTNFWIGNIQDWTSAPFVGLDNYTKLFDDEAFLKALRNTAYFVVFGVPLHDRVRARCWRSRSTRARQAARGLPRRLLPAGRHEHRRDRGRSGATCSTPTSGSSTPRSAQVGIEGPNWLGDAARRCRSIIALGVWRNIGFDMVIFLAALQRVDPQLYEAAKRRRRQGPGRCSAASRCRCCGRRSSSWPSSRPIGYLQLFEEPFVMTGGGPLRLALSVSMYVYQQGFRFFNLGYASAVAYALFMAIVVLAVIQFRFLRSDETYDHARDVPARRRAGARAARRAGARRSRRWWLYVLLSLGLRAHDRAVPLDAARLVQDAARAAADDADAAARAPDAEQLHAGCSRAARLPALLLELAADRGGDHARQPAVLLDGRLRAGQAAVLRAQRTLFLLVLGDAARAGHRHARAAVRADEQARPRQQLRGGDLPFAAGAVRRLPDAPVHARHPGRPARGGARRRRGRVHDLLADRACRCSSPRWRRWRSSSSCPPGTTSCGRSSCSPTRTSTRCRSRSRCSRSASTRPTTAC